MRLRSCSLLRLVLVPAAVALVLLSGACAERSRSTHQPTPTPSVGPIEVRPGGTGSEGLTVRSLGPDGTVKTLHVEDFPG